MADRILFLETPDIQKTPVGEESNFTADEKQKLSGIEAGAQKNTVDSVNGKTGPVTVNEVPDASGASVGQVLSKTANGLGWTTPSGGGGLPAVTASDNGKFLRVVSGAWAAQAIPAAESASFGGA